MPVRAALRALALAALMGTAAAQPGPDPAVQAVEALPRGVAAALDASLAGAHRTPEDKARDAFRRPKETLAFWGLRPDIAVIEIAPGGGYWTAIIAPVMVEPGSLTLAALNSNAAVGKGFAALVSKLANDPANYGRTRITLNEPKQGTPLGAPGSADLVIVARMMHQLIRQDAAASAMKTYFDVLKPGGVLGVEQHRWPEDLGGYGEDGLNATMGISGYVKTSEIVALAEAAGFKLEAISEINANPQDGHIHPFGVWTLAPSAYESASGARDPGFDRTAYDAIGESDRALLKFVKPE